MPKDKFGEINKNFVGFGQMICQAKLPRCWECPVKNLCPYPNKNLDPKNKSKPKINESVQKIMDEVSKGHKKRIREAQEEFTIDDDELKLGDDERPKKRKRSKKKDDDSEEYSAKSKSKKSTSAKKKSKPKFKVEKTDLNTLQSFGKTKLDEDIVKDVAEC